MRLCKLLSKFSNFYSSSREACSSRGSKTKNEKTVSKIFIGRGGGEEGSIPQE